LHSAGGASRPAALLVAKICPIFALLAPYRPGAPTASVRTLFLILDTDMERPVKGAPLLFDEFLLLLFASRAGDDRGAHVDG
jgi:hypothetical protein